MLVRNRYLNRKNTVYKMFEISQITHDNSKKTLLGKSVAEFFLPVVDKIRIAAGVKWNLTLFGVC